MEHPRINEWLEEVESSMRITLAKFLFAAVSDNKELKAASDSGMMDEEKFLAWCDKFPAQIVVLAASVSWTEEVESCFTGGEAEKGLQRTIETIDSLLGMLSKLVLLEQPPIRRKKLEHLMYEYVHRRSVTRGLVARRISSNKGPFTYDVQKIFRISDPPCHCHTHATYQYSCLLLGQPPPSPKCGHHM